MLPETSMSTWIPALQSAPVRNLCKVRKFSAMAMLRTFKSKTKGYFRDLRDFIALLEETGNLHRITARIEKNSELMPLVRWQYQGRPDGRRKGFWFETVPL